MRHFHIRINFPAAKNRRGAIIIIYLIRAGSILVKIGFVKIFKIFF